MSNLDIIRNIIPAGARKTIKLLTGISVLQERTAKIERHIADLERQLAELCEILFEPPEHLRERTKMRWRGSEPPTHLTSGIEMDGEEFIFKAASYGAFGEEKSVLEIGPGYGRLLKSMLQQRVPFKRYCGIDLSNDRIAYLRENLPNQNLDFIHGDAETIKFATTFDVMISSLTFKHLFPSFETTLQNIAGHVNQGGLLIFDLIEGEKKYFEHAFRGSVRHYKRDEILEILHRLSLEHVNFEIVRHAPGYERLLVVARKGAQ